MGEITRIFCMEERTRVANLNQSAAATHDLGVDEYVAGDRGAFRLAAGTRLAQQKTAIL